MRMVLVCSRGCKGCSSEAGNTRRREVNLPSSEQPHHMCVLKMCALRLYVCPPTSPLTP